MNRYANWTVACLACAAQAAGAAGLYIDSREVRRSDHYTGTAGDAKIAPLGTAQWLAMHDENAAELAIRDFGFVVEDGALDELVYDIANQLLANWPGTVPSMAIFVQGDRSPLSYSAWTAYTREIFVDYGVFLHADSIDEVAAVIGHELSHVLLDHGKALGFRKSLQESMDMLTRARNLQATADALSYESDTQTFSLDPAVVADLRKSATQRANAEFLYRRIHASLFSRGAEHDADRLAADLMIAAGYSPMGLKNSLERMAHSHDLSTEIADYLDESSKTLLNQALTIADRQLGDNPLNAVEVDLLLKNIENDVKSSTMAFAKQSLLKFSAKSHPVPDKRVRQIIDYIYDEYPRSVRRRQPDQATSLRFREGRIAEVLGRYVVANTSLQAVGTAEFEAAADSVDVIPGGAIHSEPYMHYVSFVASRTLGKRQAAIAQIERMPVEQLIPVHTSAELADFLADNGRRDTVSAIIERYEGYYGVIDDYYPPKIKLALAAEDQESVRSLAFDCYDAVPKDSALARQCVEASGVSPNEARSDLAEDIGILRSAEKLKSLFSN